MKRYLNVNNNPNILNEEKREMLLLNGKVCKMRCAFCDFYLDNIELDYDEKIKNNHKLLKKITGEHGVLNIINSGSVFELPDETLKEIFHIVKEKNIKIIYFESFINYIDKILLLIDKFKKIGVIVRFQLGIETFDENFRVNILKKKLTDTTLNKVKNNFYAANLLVGIKGQTKKQILKDIELGKKQFKKLVISVFFNNSTNIKRDDKLVEWFCKYCHDNLVGQKNVEIFLWDDNIVNGLEI